MRLRSITVNANNIFEYMNKIKKIEEKYFNETIFNIFNLLNLNNNNNNNENVFDDDYKNLKPNSIYKVNIKNKRRKFVSVSVNNIYNRKIKKKCRKFKKIKK